MAGLSFATHSRRPQAYQQPSLLFTSPRGRSSTLFTCMPPRQASKFSQHGGKYNACGKSVDYVKVDGAERYERAQYQARQQERINYRESKEKRKNIAASATGTVTEMAGTRKMIDLFRFCADSQK